MNGKEERRWRGIIGKKWRIDGREGEEGNKSRKDLSRQIFHRCIQKLGEYI